MDNIAKKDIMCKCKSYLKKLSSLTLKDSLDFSMTVSSSDSENSKPCFNKSIKSNSEFNLMKTVGVIMLIVGGFSLMCSICSLFKKS